MENDTNRNDIVEYDDESEVEREAISTKERISTPVMTKYEKCRIIGARATQLAMGADPLISDTQGFTDPLDIAELELKAKKIPIVVRRFLPDESYEDWDIKDLIIK